MEISSSGFSNPMDRRYASSILEILTSKINVIIINFSLNTKKPNWKVDFSREFSIFATQMFLDICVAFLCLSKG
jgi:hypothetical protein